MKKHLTLLVLFMGIVVSGFAQTYCTSGATYTYDSEVDKVVFNTINNNTTGICAQYTDFTNINTNVFPGLSYSLSVTLGTCGGNYNKYYSFFMDWNDDGDFTDAGETLAQGGYYNTTTTVTTTVNVPVNAATAQLRMRIICSESSISPSCGGYYYGETEDYSVTVLPLSGFDCAMTSIDSPTVFGVGNNDLVVTFTNLKADTIEWLDLGYQVDNNTPVLIYDYNINGNQFGKLGPGESHQYKFPTPVNLPQKGSYSLKTWVANVNDSIPDNNKPNDTFYANICTGMGGVYTVGTNGDYASLNEAYNAIKSCGIIAPIVFDVKAGTYNENLVLEPIIGMNMTNTVTFKGVNKSLVSMNSSANSVIEFNGCNYFRFENMKITGSGYCVLWYHNNANNNIVMNCDLIGNTSTSSSAYNVVNASTSVSSYSGYGDNGYDNEVSYCSIVGGYCGVVLNGASSSNVSNGWVIKENLITNAYYYGVRLYYIGRTDIERNTIKGMRYSSSYGIYNYYGQATKLNANTINPGMYGIYQYYNNYYNTVGDTSFITNNMIYDFMNSTNQCGIYLYYYNYNNQVLHNTIRVEGTSNDYNYPAIGVYYYPTGTNVKNNILVSTDASFLLRCYYPTGLNLDNNLYIYPTNKPANNYFYTGYPDTYFENFKTWQAYTDNYLSTHDENSMDNEDPHFASATDLHLTNNYPPIKVDNAGLYIDVDGDPRCIYETAIGADEPNFPVQKPNSGFISEDTVCFGSPITFVNVAGDDAKQGYWWYHDGIFKGTNKDYTYTFGPGTYTDTIMLITENCGGSDTFTKYVVVDSPKGAPIADFVSDLNRVETAFPVQFYDISQNCPDSWKWIVSPDSVNDPGFGMMPSVTYIPPTHSAHQNPWISFDYPGKFDVCLIASNSKGIDTVCKEKYIEVKPSQWMCMFVFPSVSKALFGILYDDGGPISNYQPNMACDITLQPCAKELSFAFSEFNVQTGDYFKAYEGTDNTGVPIWNTTDYPDGLTGSINDADFPDVITSSTGQMFIEWNTNASGESSGFIGEWYGVEDSFPPPTAMFTCPDTICLGMEAAFQNQSIGDNMTYSWDFNEDNFFDAFDENPIYTFMFWPGTFKVKLVVENCGGSSTYTKDIVVIQPPAAPSAEFTTDSRFPVAGEDYVQFTDMSFANAQNPFGCVNNWQWFVEPDSMLDPLGVKVPTYRFIGSGMNSQNPIILFEDTGYYTITLVTGYDMNYDTMRKVDYIYAIKYCRPTVDNLNPDIGISRVELAQIDHPSPIGKDAYTNYANEASTYLDLQGSYTLTLHRKSTYNSMNRKAWIDWNIDGDFDDAGEEIGMENEASTLSWSTTFTVPSNATEGATRMRVAASLGSMTNTSCGNRTYGEIEDYRVIIRPDGTPPEITLTAADTVYIEQCDCRTYVDAGATAMDNIDGVVPATYVEDNIDCQNHGAYYYRYEAQDSKGNVATKDRTVIVNMDMVAPTITLNGKTVDTLNYLQAYSYPGWMADDTCSGLNRVDISGMIDSSKLGDYELIYTAYDNNGNTATASRMIYVRDTEDPSISLLGYSIMDIEVHNPFVDPWVDVSDNYPCKSLDVVVSGGPVDIHTLGTYNLTYELTDCNGNGPVSVSRVVNVVDTTAPVITIAQPHYNGEVFTIEVYDYFMLPELSYTDNYKLNNMVHGGTYVAEFGEEGQSTKLGTYTYTYTVFDESGNSDFVEFTIEVVDTEAPVISLIGDYVINLCRFDTLDADDYTIDDNFDTGLELLKKRDGSYYDNYLQNMYWGFYTIIYNAVDNSGNAADQVIRYVNVQECSWYNIEEEGLAKYVNMYPNPTKGEFIVEIDLPTADNYVIKVTNMLGKELETIVETNTQGGVYRVDLGAYADGVYFVQVQTDEETTIKKVTLSK
jgi:PKD repeat protein